jgi:hypothetical protein
MMSDFFILIVAISMVILAPAVANSPADALGASENASTKIPNATIINPMDPGYVWGNPQAIVLSGTNPVVFLNSAFSAEVGGLASGPSFTSSINRFRSDDPNAGVSNATKKAAKVGLTHWP